MVGNLDNQGNEAYEPQTYITALDPDDLPGFLGPAEISTEFLVFRYRVSTRVGINFSGISFLYCCIYYQNVGAVEDMHVGGDRGCLEA